MFGCEVLGRSPGPQRDGLGRGQAIWLWRGTSAPVLFSEIVSSPYWMGQPHPPCSGLWHGSHVVAAVKVGPREVLTREAGPGSLPATHPQEHCSPPQPFTAEAREGQPLGVCLVEAPRARAPHAGSGHVAAW